MRGNKELAGLRQKEIRERVQAYFKAQLDQYLEWLDRRGLSQNALEDVREEILDHESFVDMDNPHPQWLPIKRFKRKMNVSDAEWDASLPRIALELRKGRRDMLQTILEAAERFDHYSYGGTIASTALSVPSATTLSQAIEDFIEEHSRQWPTKTTKQIQAYLYILLECFGAERTLASISKHDASEVKKVLQKLPASRNIKPALKNMPLAEVIKTKRHKRISPKTINSHIDTFRRFFVWAERHGHAEHVLFDGMKVPKAQGAELERKPFTKQQTQIIFSELTKGTLGLVRKDSHKWAALVGLFTGARLNEICQLEIADVQTDGEVWYLNITDEGDNKKRVKAKASRRQVPLHSRLIKLGFLDFVNSRNNGQRLFPDFSYHINSGYGRNMGRWYNERFLPKLGIKKPSLVFHSLRHTMVTRLGQAGVAEPIYQCIVGHTREGVTQEVYLRQGFTLLQLRDAIEQFEV